MTLCYDTVRKGITLGKKEKKVTYRIVYRNLIYCILGNTVNRRLCYDSIVLKTQ